MTPTVTVISHMEWITVVEVARSAPQAAPLQLSTPDPDNSRLYAADVVARADALYPRPHYLTQTQRREIAAQLDAEREQRRAAYLKRYGCTNPQALCTASRNARLTGGQGYHVG